MNYQIQAQATKIQIIKAQIDTLLLYLSAEGWDKDPEWVERDSQGQFSDGSGGSTDRAAKSLGRVNKESQSKIMDLMTGGYAAKIQAGVAKSLSEGFGLLADEVVKEQAKLNKDLVAQPNLASAAKFLGSTLEKSLRSAKKTTEEHPRIVSTAVAIASSVPLGILVTLSSGITKAAGGTGAVGSLGIDPAALLINAAQGNLSEGLLELVGLDTKESAISDSLDSIPDDKKLQEAFDLAVSLFPVRVMDALSEVSPIPKDYGEKARNKVYAALRSHAAKDSKDVSHTLSDTDRDKDAQEFVNANSSLPKALADPHAEERAKAANLSTPEWLALSYYTGPGYKPMNRLLTDNDDVYTTTPLVLRKQQDGGKEAYKEALEAAINLADSGLSRLPRYTPPLKDGLPVSLYRGANLSDVQLRNYQPGKAIVDPTFMSTSKELETSFAAKSNTLITIRPKLNSTVGRDISALFDNEAEKEVLYPPGTKFIVASKHKIKTSYYDSPEKEQWVVELVEL
ncbi:MAG: ADP-ribosyltransferase [Crinalium sp.]